MNGISFFVGIDPGQSGGIAVLCANEDAYAVKMPETEKDILEVIRGIYSPYAFAMLEKVGAMPKQGVVSTWEFSGNYHAIRMALIATGIPFETVPPGVWQKSMKCLTKGDKNVTKARAQELFPEIKVTHALADALLIARYCQQVRS